VGTRPGPGGSATVPSLDEVRHQVSFLFRIEAADDDVVKAVQAQLERLRKDFPAYSFEARFDVSNIEKLP